MQKYASPREEALDIAYTARKDLLDGKKDVISLLRACLVVATNLNKNNDEKWIKSELFGDFGEETPFNRDVRCDYKKFGHIQRDTEVFTVKLPISMIVSDINSKQTLNLLVDKNTEAIVDLALLELIVARTQDKCLLFLNEMIRELQYGGIVEYLMEEIRNNVDEKLAKLDNNITNEASSLYINLSSTNQADWPKVAHSCRRILQFVADKIFPPIDGGKYTMKDGVVLQIGKTHINNRLCAFVDKKLSGDRRKLLLAEAKYLNDYLINVADFTQMGEHKKDLEKFDANMIAIHTYIIISEILKLM